MKNDNKGFSLIELIVVIAIMAILVGVLAPNVLKYVRQSRVSADTQLADTIKTAVDVAIADPTVTDGPTAAVTLSFISGVGTNPSGTFGTIIAENLKYGSVANMVDDSDGIIAKFKSMTPTGITAAVDANLNVTVTVTDGTNTITVD